MTLGNRTSDRGKNGPCGHGPPNSDAVGAGSDASAHFIVCLPLPGLSSAHVANGWRVVPGTFTFLRKRVIYSSPRPLRLCVQKRTHAEAQRARRGKVKIRRSSPAPRPKLGGGSSRRTYRHRSARTGTGAVTTVTPTLHVTLNLLQGPFILSGSGFDARWTLEPKAGSAKTSSG